MGAPVTLDLSRETADIWRIRLDIAQHIGALRRALSEEERRRADRFRFPRDRDRFTIARSGLRSVLARYLSTGPAEVSLRYGEHGKPVAAGGADLQFNLSHAEDVAVVAVCPDRPVGVDVERVRRLSDLEALARRCFSEPEGRCLSVVSGGERRELFFRIWTRKEACLKALGTGFGVSPIAVRVLDDRGQVLPVAHLGEPEEGRSWRLLEFVPAEGYVAAVALEGPSNPRAVRFWEASVGGGPRREPGVHG
ncbi:MAG: 4'-phosphopantetheinyl transferase family protein [Gemmatimonadota bacterium]